ncbi:MAG: 2Fe-2S iron-sulfur cluster-binding protein [Candidatus Micrarchaeota archaeon]
MKNEGVSFEISDGSALKESLQKNSSLMFGCGQGKCGICLCSITRGSENIVPKNQDEINLLSKKNANPNQRLACQLRVIKGDVEIEY